MWISDCANMITVFIAKIFFCKRFLTTSFPNKSEQLKRYLKISRSAKPYKKNGRYFLIPAIVFMAIIVMVACF